MRVIKHEYSNLKCNCSYALTVWITEEKHLVDNYGDYLQSSLKFIFKTLKKFISIANFALPCQKMTTMFEIKQWSTSLSRRKGNSKMYNSPSLTLVSVMTVTWTFYFQRHDHNCIIVTRKKKNSQKLPPIAYILYCMQPYDDYHKTRRPPPSRTIDPQ